MNAGSNGSVTEKAETAPMVCLTSQRLARHNDFANRWCSFNCRQIKAALERRTPKSPGGDFVSSWHRGGCHKQGFCQSTRTTSEALGHHVGNYNYFSVRPVPLCEYLAALIVKSP